MSLMCDLFPFSSDADHMCAIDQFITQTHEISYATVQNKQFWCIIDAVKSLALIQHL